MILRQVVRFIFTGFINSTISFVTFSIFLYYLKGFASAALISQSIGYSVGIFSSFLINRHWTFGKREDHDLTRQFYPFIILQLIFLLGSSLSLGFLVDIKGFHAQISWLSIMVLVTVLNFLGQKYWVFR